MCSLPLDNGVARGAHSCKYEFDTALISRHLGVDKIIPVVMEPRLFSPMHWPDGTVKGKLGTKLYIDLTSDDSVSFERKVGELVTEIKRVIGEAPRSVSMGAPVCKAPVSPVVHEQTTANAAQDTMDAAPSVASESSMTSESSLSAGSVRSTIVSRNTLSAHC